MEARQQRSAQIPLKDDADAIDLYEYWLIISRYKLSIITLAIIITVITAVMTRSMPSIYSATSVIMIESGQPNVLAIKQVYGVESGATEYLSTQFLLTQFELLRSRALAEQVVLKLNLTTHPKYDPRQQKSKGGIKSLLGLSKEKKIPSDAEILISTVDKVRKSITISPVRKTHFVKVSFTTEAQELAAIVANTVAETFIENNLNARIEATQKATGWLSGRHNTLKEELKKSEQKLQSYRDKEKLVDVQGVKAVNIEEVNQLTLDLIKVRQQRTAAESSYQQVRQLHNTPTTLMKVPEVLAHPLILQFKQQEAAGKRRIAELTKRYGPKHPKMKAAIAEQRETQSQLNRQIDRVIGGIEQEFRIAQRNEKALVSRLSESKKDIKDINRKEFLLREFKLDVETNRHLYDMFLTRMKETSESNAFQSAHAKLIEAARPSKFPIKPNKKMMIIAAFGLSIVMGIVIAFMLEMLDKTIKSKSDAEGNLRLLILGQLPDKKRIKNHFNDFIHDRSSDYAEAIRNVRTSVLLTTIEPPAQIIMLSSSVNGEGKSITALNLGSAFGQMEKTLVIDANLRRPTLAQYCGTDTNIPGLSNLINDSHSLEECIHELEAGDIDILPAGVITTMPLELLSSKRFLDIIKNLRTHYDRIIIDSPSLQSYSDALIIANHSDAIIHIIKTRSAAISTIKNDIERIHQSIAPIIGIIINQVIPTKKPRRSHRHDRDNYNNSNTPVFNRVLVSNSHIISSSKNNDTIKS